MPAFSDVTTDANLDTEANQAYTHFKHGKGISPDTNVAYETVKQDLSTFDL